ncbi:hypothetical protein GC105_16230 [Alkalibaculum sp. M08DMB]|uniref:Prepilin-type N-terminal cleavage/methylation domain-containing protein n=1 Tax=Alkalibaculum sporogenes TaxID=2655001 RepID=A0A6A7KCY5_9FIRM|nr:hypothetical protein [Alkalibaculum sporogenes]MPW27314.1 hypothetical protein [Alkalibaculum sporogenes]
MIIKNNCKGITVVELIIVVALIIVVLTIAFNALFVSKKSFDIGLDKATLQQNARVIANQVTERLKFAKSISHMPILTGEDYYKISLQDNTTTGFKDMVVEKYNSAGGVVYKEVIDGFINELTFTTYGLESQVVNFVLNVNTGITEFTINSAVKIVNTKANISNSNYIYYCLYD